ncbi:hypothetical protein B0T37_04320 [Chromobacterium violaceum]|uniref:hypothetical protein n=1 Tax=Chromobacterium violaceum TaxID=536 RepID=UPI0009DA8E22|nr:hypothetical protein [Chromobacterium violaceum]OQS11667.1 hypothetical protein B0T38_02970 [Chromobacterium violaceum]OQS29198.1 hypothetical protein B0T37_04320 [Chromobacterium violaceum]
MTDKPLNAVPSGVPLEIIITVSGGMVSAVYASHPNCSVTVLDWDDAADDGADYFPMRGFASRATCEAQLRQLIPVG